MIALCFRTSCLLLFVFSSRLLFPSSCVPLLRFLTARRTRFRRFFSVSRVPIFSDRQIRLRNPTMRLIDSHDSVFVWQSSVNRCFVQHRFNLPTNVLLNLSHKAFYSSEYSALSCICNALGLIALDIWNAVRWMQCPRMEFGLDRRTSK